MDSLGILKIILFFLTPRPRILNSLPQYPVNKFKLPLQQTFTLNY